MGMRLLTKKFTAYNIGKCEKEYNKEFMEFLDIGKLSVSKMLILIRMGNNYCSTEEAAKILDEYMSEPENSLLDAYVQLLEELDKDQRILRMAGINSNKLREMMKSEMENKVTPAEKVEEAQVVNNITVLKENETPKVDVNGFVSLD